MADKLERIKLLESIRKNPDLMSLVHERCRRDILFWFDWFAITFDPRPDPITKKPIGVIPFILYPYQRELVKLLQEHIDEGTDLLIEKCRDMGVSWVVLLVYFWYWLFRPDTNFRVGSRNINEVDKPGDAGTMFEKLRMELLAQPDFLRPKGFVWAKHCTYAKMVNPTTRASIIGETANPSFGRSSRNTSALYDELAFWEADNAAWSSGGQTTPCRIAVSTPYGQYNRFAKMALGKLTDKPKKLTYYWWLNPKHDQKWYDQQKERNTPAELAREVEISYTGSLEGGIFSEMFQTHLHCMPVTTQPSTENPDNLWVPNPDYPITVILDFGKTCAALLLQVDAWHNVDVFHEIVIERGSTEELAQAVLSTINKYNMLHPRREGHFVPKPIEYLDPRISESLPRTPFSGSDSKSYALQFTGDPAGQTKPWQMVDGFSDHNILDGYNIRPMQLDKILAVKPAIRKGAAISLIQSFLMRRFRNRERFLIRNPDKCPILIQALSGEYRYKTDTNGDVTEVIHEVHPIEDVMDCLMYALLQFASILPHNFDNNDNIHRAVIESNYEFPI
jgi:hypothetical protein